LKTFTEIPKSEPSQSIVKEVPRGDVKNTLKTFTSAPQSIQASSVEVKEVPKGDVRNKLKTFTEAPQTVQISSLEVKEVPKGDVKNKLKTFTEAPQTVQTSSIEVKAPQTVQTSSVEVPKVEVISKTPSFQEAAPKIEQVQPVAAAKKPSSPSTTVQTRAPQFQPQSKVQAPVSPVQSEKIATPSQSLASSKKISSFHSKICGVCGKEGSVFNMKNFGGNFFHEGDCSNKGFQEWSNKNRDERISVLKT